MPPGTVVVIVPGRQEIDDDGVGLADGLDAHRIPREVGGVDRGAAALPVVAFELQRAVLGLGDLVGDDVAVGEREPEAAAGAAGLEVGAAVVEGVADVGRAADVELTADDVARTPRVAISAAPAMKKPARSTPTVAATRSLMSALRAREEATTGPWLW